MFEEIWLIKDALCFYHKAWTSKPLKVEGNLFSAFLTAFKSFQEEVFPTQAMRHIDFFSDRLVFVATKYFYVVVRDQLEKPTERSLMQLTNISSELVELIENEPDLYQYFDEKGTKPVSLHEIHDKITPSLENIIEMLSMAERQVNQFDIMTILQIMHEVKELVLEISDEQIFHGFARTESNSWFFDKLNAENQNEQQDHESIPVISYRELNEIAIDYINQVRSGMVLYGVTNKDLHYINLHNRIMSFLSMNAEALKRFGVIDSVLSGLMKFFRF